MNTAKLILLLVFATPVFYFAGVFVIYKPKHKKFRELMNKRLDKE